MNKIKNKVVLFLFFALLGTAFNSCSTKSATSVILSNEAEGVDLRSYSKYAWLPSDADFEEIAIMAVEDQLNSRGYERDTENPDFLVAVHVINEATEELVRTPLYSNLDYRGPDYYASPFQNYYFTDQITVPIVSNYTNDELNYAEGTVVVDVIDREKMEIVWRGWSEDQRPHPLDVASELPEYISQIFNKFPVDTNE